MSKKTMSESLEQRRASALRKAKRWASSLDGVTGIDFGFKYKNGIQTRRQGIRIHVERKLTLGAIPPDQMIPTEIDGIPVDVIEARYDLHALDPRMMFDPIRPGISIGNQQRDETGTLGAIVYDKETGAPCVLSNWHVLCANPDCRVGEPITQPGPHDMDPNSPPRIVAQLLRWTDLSHGIDAAVGRLVPGVAQERKVFGADVVVEGVTEPKVNMKLVKVGISSGVTHARIDGKDGAFRMDYSDFGDRARFMDAIRLVPDPDNREDEISLSGDSGAVWFDPVTRRGVALHFGGEDGTGPLSDYAVAHPLTTVLARLRVVLTPPTS